MAIACAAFCRPGLLRAMIVAVVEQFRQPRSERVFGEEAVLVRWVLAGGQFRAQMAARARLPELADATQSQRCACSEVVTQA